GVVGVPTISPSTTSSSSSTRPGWRILSTAAMSEPNAAGDAEEGDGGKWLVCATTIGPLVRSLPNSSATFWRSNSGSVKWEPVPLQAVQGDGGASGFPASPRVPTPLQAVHWTKCGSARVITSSTTFGMDAATRWMAATCALANTPRLYASNTW